MEDEFARTRVHDVLTARTCIRLERFSEARAQAQGLLFHLTLSIFELGSIKSMKVIARACQGSKVNSFSGASLSSTLRAQGVHPYSHK